MEGGVGMGERFMMEGKKKLNVFSLNKYKIYMCQPHCENKELLDKQTIHLNLSSHDHIKHPWSIQVINSKISNGTYKSIL